MKLDELKPGDVFETRDGRQFLRTGIALWKKDNVLSLDNYVPGTMTEKTEVFFLGHDACKTSIIMQSHRAESHRKAESRRAEIREAVPFASAMREMSLREKMSDVAKLNAQRIKDASSNV